MCLAQLSKAQYLSHKSPKPSPNCKTLLSPHLLSHSPPGFVFRFFSQIKIRHSQNLKESSPNPVQLRKMGSRLGRRVVHFPNLPIKLLMPTSFTNIKEIALKTIPSASKIEIKRVLESLYGFEVEKVETLNMDGKKKKRGGLLIAKPDYKKAYVTLRNPLSLNPELFPIRAIEEDKMNTRKKSAASSIVEDPDAVKKSHWLDESRDDGGRVSNSRIFRRRVDRRPANTGETSPQRAVPPPPPPAKFPWSSMKGLGK